MNCPCGSDHEFEQCCRPVILGERLSRQLVMAMIATQYLLSVGLVLSGIFGWPLLLVGILVSGWIMGRPGRDAGLLPSAWVASWVGGNGLAANLLAAVAGAFMYFATLTEVPILQTLLGAGLGRGPALTLLLAGPALSLPSMLVIYSYLGGRKTAAYVSLVVVIASTTGWMYGRWLA